MSVRLMSDPKTICTLLGIAVLLGALHGVVDGPSVLVGLVGGGVSDLLIGTSVAVLEIFYVYGRAGRPLVRRPLWQLLTTRLILYLAITLVALKIGHHAGDFLLPPDRVHGIRISLKDVGVSLSVAMIVTFFGILDAQLGGRALLGLLIGRYLRPRSEMRVFLVADLIGSTSLAARVGHERFLDYLNDVFSEMAGPIA